MTASDAYKYELIVFWSSEDGAFVVDVPELPGCMAHGATPSEAVAQAQEAIALWVDTARTGAQRARAEGAPAAVRVAPPNEAL